MTNQPRLAPGLLAVAAALLITATLPPSALAAETGERPAVVPSGGPSEPTVTGAPTSAQDPAGTTSPASVRSASEAARSAGARPLSTRAATPALGRRTRTSAPAAARLSRPFAGVPYQVAARYDRPFWFPLFIGVGF